VWLVLAGMAAIGTTAREVIVKSVMRPGEATVVALVVAAGTASVLAPFALLAGLQVSDGSYWWSLVVSGSINAAAAVMIVRAVHTSDLSLVSPLQSTTPLFMILTGAVFLGELPSARGAGGIVLIAAGAYVLNMADRGSGLLAPVRALGADPGARLFLGVAVLYAVSGAVDKVGVLASTPLTWTFTLHLYVAVSLAAVSFAQRRAGHARAVLARAPLRLGAAGAVMAVGALAQMTALPLTLAAHVIAVKRTSVLISVVAGGVVFRERHLLQRLTGAAIMLAGLVLLSLA
jgi:uncharacterized membrane protein